MSLRKEFKKTQARVEKIANIINSTQAYVMYTNGFVLGGSSGGGGGTTYTGSNGVIVNNTTHVISLDDGTGGSTMNLGNATIAGDFTLAKGAHFTAGSGAEVNVECELSCSDVVDFSAIKDITYPTLTLTESTAGSKQGIVTYENWSKIYTNKAYQVVFNNSNYYFRDVETNLIIYQGVNGIIKIKYQAPISPATEPTIIWKLFEEDVISLTWSELKALRDAGTLVAGQYYRITDYVATTTQTTTYTDTQSANHPFDLVVFAIANNKLSENCYAAHHSGDTYFANTDLSAWDIWYCLDNDTNRFGWADTTNGKGVIYYLKDEFNNSCWYDWKGIKVKNSNSSDRFYYLFDNSGADASLSPSTSFPTVYGNKLGFFVIANKLYIGCNIFKGSTITENTIGNNFYSNTIGNSFSSNIIGSAFLTNIIGDYFIGNTIGNAVQGNTIGDTFQSNTIGNSFIFNNTTTQTSQPMCCSFPSGVSGLITTSTTLTRLTNTTYYIGSDSTLKTLD